MRGNLSWTDVQRVVDAAGDAAVYVLTNSGKICPWDEARARGIEHTIEFGLLLQRLLRRSISSIYAFEHAPQVPAKGASGGV